MNTLLEKNTIHIVGARQHNLKNLNLDIPRDELVVICGPSGSGKTTLAFDLVYAEGQRRYVESLSAYARQFLPKMDKPDVDKIEGLSPAISLEQQNATRNPRSTVGTVTELYDFLRVFFARLGLPHCPQCGKSIQAQSADEIINTISGLAEGTRLFVLAPLVEAQKGTQVELLKRLRAEGFARLRIDGQIFNLDAVPPLDKNKKHSLDLLVDRLIVRPDIRPRLADSVELALRYGEGRLTAAILDEQAAVAEEILFSTFSACPDCKISLPELSPQLFSFNSPQGACQRCLGLGAVEYFEPVLIAPNQGISINEGALLPLKNATVAARYHNDLLALSERFHFSLDSPLEKLPEEGRLALFYGEQAPGLAKKETAGNLRRNWLGGSVQIKSRTGAAGKMWPGVISILERGMHYGNSWRDELARYRQNMPCPECAGARLNQTARSVRVNGLSLVEFCNLSVERALFWLEAQQFNEKDLPVAEPLLKEIAHRLQFMGSVGLGYLSLGRSMGTLSGGEAQRIRLASQLGSGLVGVTYVLDEPSIGLHPRDNLQLIRTLRDLQRRGNTVLVVEHDEATIREADTVLELGPGSGEQGGELVFQGNVSELLRSQSLTARYLRRELSVARPAKRRVKNGELIIKNAQANNLRHLDCRIPLGVFTCVTGVSGSGKSSLVIDTIYKHLALSQGIKVDNPGTVGSFEGLKSIERVIAIDQTPIGRTPRSNPATYTKIFDEIRTIFSQTPDAKKKGYAPGRFSFNVPGGRCEACKGDGQIRVEMHFLPDVFVQCDVCQGKRYKHETLQVRYKGLNIAEILDLTVQQAKEFFSSYPPLERRLHLLEQVGLDYLRLGQPATTLSGGEAQRIKISRELSKKNLPKTLYILDEPTTGLHMHEVGKLISVLHRLVDKQASVLVIEHNSDVIMCADYVIDLGPGGGENGGLIIAQGTPEELLVDPASVTGAFLAKQ